MWRTPSISRSVCTAADALWWQGSVGKIVCIGRNYAAHAHELNNKVPSKPFWFLKPPSALSGGGAPHECPPGRDESHHELELGVVIGRRARRVSAERAMSHVSGYCLALDMTDRTGQAEAKAAGKPWTAAKGWDSSCPVSDQLIPAGLVEDYRQLEMWLTVNGEQRQHGSPGAMIFDIPRCIAAISAVHTLEPGDLVLTGTPEGVGPVVPGDVIRAGCVVAPGSELEIEVPVVAGGSPWW